MKRLRWQHWLLIAVFAAIAYLVIMVLVFAFSAD